MTPFAAGKYAGENPPFVPTWYLRELLGDVTGDGLRWADLSAGAKTDVINEIAQRGAGGGMILGVANGYRLARGSVACTSTTSLATGLTTITGFAISVHGLTGTVNNHCAKVSAKIQASTPGSLTARRWKHTGPSTATYVSATVAGTIAWIAIGT